MTPTAPRQRTSGILAELAADTNITTITLEDVLERIETRAFGFLLIFLALPNLIPVPTGVGGVCGPLAAFLGLQMMVGMEHPWIPRWIRRRGLPREPLAKFLGRLSRIMGRIERLCQPRWLFLTEGLGERFSGLVLIVLGLLLALPIPFTNIPLGMALLVTAIALTERDGVLLVACWLVTIASLVSLGVAGDVLLHHIREWWVT